MKNTKLMHRKRKAKIKVRDMSHTFNQSNSCIKGVSEGEKRKNMAVEIVKEIITKNFPQLMKTSIQTQKLAEEETGNLNLTSESESRT